MGRKYEKYVAATKRTQKARADLEAKSGGSTSDALRKAQHNAFAEQENADRLWEEFLEDPEG